MCNLEDLQNRLAKFGQAHLLMFYDELSDDEQKSFVEQLSNIDFENINQLFRKAVTSMKTDVQELNSRMTSIDLEDCEENKLDLYYKLGLEAISQGHVGVLLMAGGQGTRLGTTYPKGMCSVGLSGKSLFQMQAERIRRIQQLAQQETGKMGKITWYIMTSESTVEVTTDFIAKKNYFGLNSDDVIIFQQELLPCFNFEGKILLEDRNKISLAPDGNGGIFRALQKSHLGDMEQRGIKYIHAHGVDNVLVKVADPVFIGYCITKGADCGVKVVRKQCPTEALGVVCKVDGKFHVVEYSEISYETANLKNSKGNLEFNAANICNHFFTTIFLRNIADKFESDLKLHVAKKAIPYINDRGQKIKPSSPNGIKIEKFIFDVFQFSDNFVIWEVSRDTEFSALKNSDESGKDCPSIARKAIFSLHKKYIENAGGVVIGDEIEISNLLSYAGEGLDSIVKGKTFITPTYLMVDEEG